MDNQLDERCTALEMKLSYLEDFVNKLQNEVVYQGRIIDALKTENKLISGKVHDIADSLEEIPNRKPPHY